MEAIPCDGLRPRAGEIGPIVRRRFMKVHANRASGFSLIELVIVVVIIGIIAAIAIPRMSRGSAGAADNACASDLAILRSAVDLYQTEHGKYPDVNIMTQLAGTTDSNGNVGTGTSYPYGPYLRTV